VAEARTSFEVSKVFSDDNSGSVEVVLNCFTGLPLTQSQTISNSQNVVFIVTDFDVSELDCTVSESETEGYTPSYAPSLGQTGIAGSIGSTDEACTFDDVVGGRMICQITNTLDEVTITVNKEWIVSGPGEAEEQDVRVELHCDGKLGQVGTAWINPNQPGVFTFLPHYNGTHCYVTEGPVDGAETDDSDCQDLFVEPLDFMYRMYGMPRAHDCRDAGGRATQEQLPRRSTADCEDSRARSTPRNLARQHSARSTSGRTDLTDSHSVCVGDVLGDLPRVTHGWRPDVAYSPYPPTLGQLPITRGWVRYPPVPAAPVLGCSPNRRAAARGRGSCGSALAPPGHQEPTFNLM
jgi:hypothetical protein